jgi:hypothetical protein
MSNLQKKWSALLHKISYLRFELDDKQEKIAVYEKELTQKFNNVADESDHQAHFNDKNKDLIEKEKKIKEEKEQDSSEQSSVDVDEPVEENLVESCNNESIINDSFKKVWKQIALKTHPDIASGNPELYKKAQQAWNTGKLEVLLDIAAELSITVPDPTEDMIKTLEERVNNIEKEIKKIESNTLWAWGSAEEDKRDVIVNEILKFRRKKYQM